VQILNPSTKTWESMQELIQESYQLSKNRFEKR
jgi:predicted DNA-binding protein (MmcQ/YjbR family)